MKHLEVLAGEIGPRVATMDGEREAAEYIRDQFEAAGYIATLEEFEVQATLAGSADLELPEGAPSVAASPFNGSGEGTVTGRIVMDGLGHPEDLAGIGADGAVLVLDRGELTFWQKTQNARAAGAAALIIVNNEARPFRGNLGQEADIPVVAVARDDRETLAQLVGDEVTLTVDTNRLEGTSRNVVGRPSDAPCTAYMGAHYDSVLAGPGANDNASGTSLLIELARARRIEGLCVIAFGAEEVGLVGSRAFVRDHDVSGAAFMLNFDMVAKMTNPAFIGDAMLTAEAARIASERGLDVRAIESIGPGMSSDHAPFEAQGVPILFFYSGDDEFIHTAQDDLDNVSEDDLGRFLEVAVAMLDQLLAG